MVIILQAMRKSHKYNYFWYRFQKHGVNLLLLPFLWALMLARKEGKAYPKGEQIGGLRPCLVYIFQNVGDQKSCTQCSRTYCKYFIKHGIAETKSLPHWQCNLDSICRITQ